MSQYISSFLIDPVIRQARRLSRPSFTASESDHDDVQEAASTAVADSPRQYLSFRTPSFNLPAILGSRDDISSSSNPTYPIEYVATSESQESLRLVEITSLEPAINARQYAVRRISDTLLHPSDTTLDNVETTRSCLETTGVILPTDLSGAGLPTSYNDHGRNTLNEGDGGSCTAGLPADDGMSNMRRRILAIQRTDSSHEVKARLVYDVMTETHHASSRARSPVSVQSSGRPVTPSSPKSASSIQPGTSPPTSSSSAGDSINPFQLTVGDLKPTYWERSPEDIDDAEGEVFASESLNELRPLGCAHYKRNIKLQCSACHRWYPCRFCHDAMEDHMLNRRETKNMLCMLCGCAQPASQQCVLCTHPAAWYYCNVCKLWDDHPSKEIYHCEECGICRIGAGVGKSHLHCKTCNVCMEISHFERHKCVERSLECNCPICGEYLFTSPDGVVFMPCGHSIHRGCYSELMRATYRCPICSRSITNMERQFLDLRREIMLQPMPEEFRDTKAWIHCNDCLAKTKVRYHWIGLECEVCKSFNTVQQSLLASHSRSPSPSPNPSQSSGTAPSLGQTDRLRSAIPGQQLRTSLSLPSLNLLSPSLAYPSLAGDPFPRPSSLPPSRTMDPSSASSDRDSDAMSYSDEADDYSEVDFWGRESPRIFSTSPPSGPMERLSVASEDDDDDDDEDDSDDPEDEDATMDDDDEDDDGEESGFLDQLEIIGHR